MESVVILTTVAAVMAITIGCVSHISKGCYLNKDWNEDLIADKNKTTKEKLDKM